MSPAEFYERFVAGCVSARREEIWGLFNYSIIDQIVAHDIRCEIWIDGSFVTECDEPNDIDGSIMVEVEQIELLSDEAIAFLEGFDDSVMPFHPFLDIFLCVIYPKNDDRRSDLSDPDGWAKQWSMERNSDWLKGFVVIPFR